MSEPSSRATRLAGPFTDSAPIHVYRVDSLSALSTASQLFHLPATSKAIGQIFTLRVRITCASILTVPYTVIMHGIST